MPQSTSWNEAYLNASGALQYHGPTSMFVHTGCLDSDQQTSRQGSSIGPEIWSHMRFATTVGIDQSLIAASLSLFFIHQYPQYMFVYREALLEDYLGDAHGGKYWSLPLVFAICALGAVHSADQNIAGKAHLLANCAREIIITDGLSKPQATTIQALLCLAFHELGQGNSTQGWMFSGKSTHYD